MLFFFSKCCSFNLSEFIFVLYSHPSSKLGFQEGAFTVSQYFLFFFMAPFDFWEVILARCQRGKDWRISSIWFTNVVSSPCRRQPIKGFASVRYTYAAGALHFSALLLQISHWQKLLFVTGAVIWGLLALWLRGSEVCLLKWKANGAKEKHVKRKRDPGAESQTVCRLCGVAAGGYVWVILNHL